MTNMIVIAAMHLAALGQIESGDRDAKVGSMGEVSRYQIMPSVWRATVDELGLRKIGVDPKSESDARIVANQIWCSRAVDFEWRRSRKPTVVELYLLWHCPARVSKPTKADREIATRFANLVEKLSMKKT